LLDELLDDTHSIPIGWVPARWDPKVSAKATERLCVAPAGFDERFLFYPATNEYT